MKKDLLTLAKLAKILQTLPKDKKEHALEVMADYSQSGEEIREISAIRSNGWADSSVEEKVVQAHEQCVAGLYVSIYGLEMEKPFPKFDNKEIEAYIKSIATKPVSQKLHDKRMKFLREACQAYVSADEKQRCLFVKESHKKSSQCEIITTKKIIPLRSTHSKERC